MLAEAGPELSDYSYHAQLTLHGIPPREHYLIYPVRNVDFEGIETQKRPFPQREGLRYYGRIR